MRNAFVQWAITIVGFLVLVHFVGFGGALGIVITGFVIVVSIIGVNHNRGRGASSPPHHPDDLYSDPPE